MAKQSSAPETSAKKTGKDATSGSGANRFRKSTTKTPKAQKVKKQRFARTREIGQAYKLLKPNDPMLGAWIGLGAVLGLIVGFFAVVLVSGWTVFGIILGAIVGLLFAVLFGMIVFGFRAKRTTYKQAEGRAGSAAWAMEQMRGDWRISQATTASMQQDLVHRVIGRPGVVLVGEGTSGRLASLLAQEKKKLARMVGETPIYIVTVGNEQGDVSLKKLNSHIMKLPRNIDGGQIRALEKRLKAVAAPKMPLPKGPMPGGRQMSVSARQMRRKGM